jgi:hypothetical protein
MNVKYKVKKIIFIIISYMKIIVNPHFSLSVRQFFEKLLVWNLARPIGERRQG